MSLAAVFRATEKVLGAIPSLPLNQVAADHRSSLQLGTFTFICLQSPLPFEWRGNKQGKWSCTKRNPQATPSSSGWNSSLHHHGHFKAPALHKTLLGAFKSRIAFLLGEDFSSRPVSVEHPLNQILISEDYYNNSKNHRLTARALEREHKGFENAL